MDGPATLGKSSGDVKLFGKLTLTGKLGVKGTKQPPLEILKS